MVDQLSQNASLVERFYELAKRGDWPAVLAGWRSAPAFARRCAHFVAPVSGWGFLHQAAYFGSRGAVVVLVGWGGDVRAADAGGETPIDVARRRGHVAVADLLELAVSPADLWAPPDDASVLPSSSLWAQAHPRIATAPMTVGYGGGRVEIAPGETYWVDSFERTLVGWHGTFSPPLGMDGHPVVAAAGGVPPL